MQTVDDMIRRAVSWAPDACALKAVETGEKLSYAELDARIDAAAAALQANGLEPGMIVVVVAPNTIATIVTILGAHRAALVPALLNPRLKPEEIATLVSEANARACLVETDPADHAALADRLPPQTQLLSSIEVAAAPKASPLPVAPATPEQPAFIFYTSGTTGLPKGVVIPHRATEPRVLFMSTQVGHTVGSHNQVAGLMPIFHVIGFYAVLVMALSFGGTYHLFAGFEPRRVIKAITARGITALFATPTHLQMIVDDLEAEDDLSALRYTAFAGSQIHQPLLDTVRARWPGRIVHIYGTTEAMNSLFMADPDRADRLRPSFWSRICIARTGDGPIMPVSAGQSGELLVSADGGAVFTEYLGRPEATAAKLVDGWYRTSDAAIVHTTGEMELLGRIDDTIISGGENIHPAEVEAVLVQHPAITDAAVVGLPDATWGQSVTAAVVTAGTASPDMLDAYLRNSALADFKRPRAYLSMTQLPRNASGKIDRARLVSDLQERTQSTEKP